MKKVLLSIGIITLIFVIIFYAQSIRAKKHREEIESMCAQADSIYRQGFTLTGFSYSEVKNILVKEFSNNSLIDSFIIHPNEYPFDSIRQRHEAFINNRGMNIKNVYQFYIEGQKPYILSNITLKVQTHRSMLSEIFGCDIVSYQLNHEISHYGGYIDLKKSGYKFPWEK